MTTTQTPSTTADALPPAGRWLIDAGHTEVGFVGRHFGLTRVRGRFPGVTGTLLLPEDPQDAELTVEIDMASVESGDAARDEHLRSPDLFDVDTHPTARFTSTAVRPSGQTATVEGDLTIRDVTRQVALAVEYLGHVHDPWGNERVVFSARGTIDRSDWGLTWNMVLDAGGLLVSKQIQLEIEAELIRDPS